MRLAGQLAVASVFLLAACEQEPVKLELSGETMGTTYSVVALDRTGMLDREAMQAAVDGALAQVNAQMNNWDPNSEISRFNGAEGTEAVPISAELAEVMAAAYQVHERSLGRFDLTLGPVIELWGFGARTAESPVPSDEAISEALAETGQRDVLEFSADAATLRKLRDGTTVYLAAIAKGYGVDAVADALEELGLEDFMVEIGGDLYVAGSNPDGAPWRIGIEKPDAASRTVQEIVELTALGMATSGDYRNYVEENGVRYSHIIDGETGRPITHRTASVTVLAESAMMADAWATAFLALGREQGMEIAEKYEIAAFFIDRDPLGGEGRFETAASPQFAALQARSAAN
ncbi:MAG: FAD:protein FMN transferase [Pseudomonadota bacterium]